MCLPKILVAIALALLLPTLAACEHSSPAPVDVGLGAGVAYRVTLPAAPADVAACLRRDFPEIPDRALTRADVVGIIGAAKLLDRSKRACGERALAWIEGVRRRFAR